MYRLGICLTRMHLEERPVRHPIDLLLLPTGLVLCGFLGCSPQPKASSGHATRSIGSVIERPPADTTPPLPRDTGPDPRPRLARLEREARALAKLDGCATAGDCRTAPMGWRGCGGRRPHLVYCRASTGHR